MEQHIKNTSEIMGVAAGVPWLGLGERNSNNRLNRMKQTSISTRIQTNSSSSSPLHQAEHAGRLKLHFGEREQEEEEELWGVPGPAQAGSFQ